MDGKSQDDGAIAVIVAVFVGFVAIGLLALAADIGSLWQSQRALVTDTDAAALAGAIELAEDWMENGGTCGDRAAAEAEAVSVLGLNNPEEEATNTDVATDADCEPNPATAGDFSGWVEMSASQPSPGFFSGRDDLSANGTTTAEFVLGISAFEEGLAICADLFPIDVDEPGLASQFLLNDGRFAIPYGLNADGTLREELGADCGIGDQLSVKGTGGSANQTPGGWGWLNPPADSPCELDAEDDSPLPVWCPIRTGTSDINSFDVNVDQRIFFPIFDAWNGERGSKAELRIVGYLSAVVDESCKVTGTGTGPKDPQLCNDGDNLSETFNGQQSHFIVVSEADPFLLAFPQVEMFNTASYSICDVQGDRRFCRSTG